jgi:hypothetical protein
MTYGIERVVSELLEKQARFDLPTQLFQEAYQQLRQRCPTGNVLIRLDVVSAEAPTAEGEETR